MLKINFLFAIALGGALGSLGRYTISVFMQKDSVALFPWATLIANLIGSFLIGVVFVLATQKLAFSETWHLFLKVGLLGALTTFSTFSLETVQLLGQGNYFYGFSNLVLNIFCTLIAYYSNLASISKSPSSLSYWIRKR